MDNLEQQEDHPEQGAPFWSLTDVLIYNDELIVFHPGTPWFVGIIVHWKLHLFRFLEDDEDKLRLAWCIANGIMSCDPTPGRFLIFDSTYWRQLDIVDATVFVLKCLRDGFGATRHQAILMQDVHRHGLGEFVRFNPNNGDNGQLEDADFDVNELNDNGDHDNANNDFGGPLEDADFDVNDFDGFDLLEGAVWEEGLLDDIRVDEGHEVDGNATVSLD